MSCHLRLTAQGSFHQQVPFLCGKKLRLAPHDVADTMGVTRTLPQPNGCDCS